MQTKAEIICDSIGPNGIRLTTFRLVFPRFILPEFNTHRMFSRNASSSRAIPVSRQIEIVKDTPFIPIAFNKNAKGMQGGEKLSTDDQLVAESEWLKARDSAVSHAQTLLDKGIAKQYVNRILEPFGWTTVVCTATDWDNFFALRCHEAAQPEIHALADLMYEKYNSKQPEDLFDGEWHLPFIQVGDRSDANHYTAYDNLSYTTEEVLIMRSIARCARVSYLNHDGTKTSTDADIDLYRRLVGSAPIHASPAEHQAMAVGDPNVRSGNFRGWIQYRKILKDENVVNFKK